MKTSHNIEHPWLTFSHSREHYPTHSGDGLPLIIAETPLCYAVISLQGAQLLEFIPKDKSPLLWLSPYAEFSQGVAIRGGIPVCLPWFGVNADNPQLPKHGFARNRDWQLTKATTNTDTHLELVFQLHYQGETPELFEHSFLAEITMTLSNQLQLSLSVTNQGTQTTPCSWALHSYFPVENLNATRVSGLNGISYLDNTNKLAEHQQQGDIVFDSEVDRAYLNTPANQTIEQSNRILIQGKNCDSAIVWNPGKTLAQSIGDIKDSYDQFICVERGAVHRNQWLLHAKEQRKADITLSFSEE